MMKKIALYLAIMMLLSVNSSMANELRSVWSNYRGVNIGPEIEEKDIKALADMSVNIVRVSFNSNPLIQREAPYEYRQDVFKKFDLILNWCSKYNIKVIMDPHTFPGMSDPTSMHPRDPFWQSYEWHDIAINFWMYVATRYKDKGEVIVAYDVINEPSGPNGIPKSGPGSWNELAKKLVFAIRSIDKKTTIIIEPIRGNDSNGKSFNRIEGMNYLQPIDDDNIVYSPHMYQPVEFTHQGIGIKVFQLLYPGEVEGAYWNKEKLRSVLAPIAEFENKYNVPIFIGEFSVTRWAGDSGNRYIEDLISIFEEQKWGWAYHAFRQAQAWDPELSNYERYSPERNSNTPRMMILKKYWQKNVN